MQGNESGNALMKDFCRAKFAAELKESAALNAERIFFPEGLGTTMGGAAELEESAAPWSVLTRWEVRISLLWRVRLGGLDR